MYFFLLTTDLSPFYDNSVQDYELDGKVNKISQGFINTVSKNLF